MTNSAVIHGLCAMTFQSAMHCSLRLTPTMINHLTSTYYSAWVDYVNGSAVSGIAFLSFEGASSVVRCHCFLNGKR